MQFFSKLHPCVFVKKRLQFQCDPKQMHIAMKDAMIGINSLKADVLKKNYTLCAGLTKAKYTWGMSPRATHTAVKLTVFPFSEQIGCKPDAG